MPRGEDWSNYKEGKLPQVIKQRNKKVSWANVERWWRKHVGTPRGAQSIRSKIERWQMKEMIRELSAHQSVYWAEGAPSVPRRVEDGLGKSKVLGVRSLSLVGKPRKAKRLRRQSKWSVPLSPELMAIVKGPSKRLLQESDQPVEQAGCT
jgi:hypothetical protein